jgi:chitinase
LKARYGNLLVTAAVYCRSTGKAYDVSAMCASDGLDFINLMTYDIHGSWDSTTGHNAPLENDYYSVTDSALSWANSGCPRSKIVIGMATYGRTFTLSTGSNGMGAPASGPGNAGPTTNSAGFLAYFEICNAGFTRVWNAAQKVPFGHTNNQWVGYDDPESISLKCSLVTRESFGGAMFWVILFFFNLFNFKN